MAFIIEPNIIYGFKNLSDESKGRILKLTGRIYGADHATELNNLFYAYPFNQLNIALCEVRFTDKTHTEYALARVYFGKLQKGKQIPMFPAAIQTRFITKVGQIQNHPLTDQFLPNFNNI